MARLYRTARQKVSLKQREGCHQGPNALQIKPVRVTANCCGYDNTSGGFLKSLTLATVIPHFIVGAQKKTKETRCKGLE